MQPPNVDPVVSSIAELVKAVSKNSALMQSMLSTYADREAALLASRVVEIGSVTSSQGYTAISTPTSSIFDAQTGDVEVIEGIYLWVTGLPAADTVSAQLQVDNYVFPVTFSDTLAQYLFAPIQIPVTSTKRALTVVATSGTYSTVNVLMWGHVAPGRTRSVH